MRQSGHPQIKIEKVFTVPTCLRGDVVQGEVLTPSGCYNLKVCGRPRAVCRRISNAVDLRNAFLVLNLLLHVVNRI